MDISNMMGMLGNFQHKIKEAQQKLDDITIYEQGNGISITVTASKKIKDISIASDYDKDELEDLLVITLNKALDKAGQRAEEEMKSVSNGMLPNLPGLF